MFDNKEHGLGHLLNPIARNGAGGDWRRVIWQWAVAKDRGDPFDEPEWFGLPAVSKIRASSPILIGPFAALNEGLTYGAQVKPFNFLLSVHVSPNGHPAGTDPTRFHLVAKHENDPAKWMELDWVDIYSGVEYRLGTRADTPPSWVRVKTYKEVAEFFRSHPEPKSADRNGAPVAPNTIGLLRRREIRSVAFEFHGKESNRLEEVQGGLVHDPGEVGVLYGSSLDFEWEAVLPLLKDYTAPALAAAVAKSVRYIRDIRNEKVTPSDRVKTDLISFVRRT